MKVDSIIATHEPMTVCPENLLILGRYLKWEFPMIKIKKNKINQREGK